MPHPTIQRIAYIASIDTDEANAPASHVKGSVSQMARTHDVELWRAKTTLRQRTVRKQNLRESLLYFPPYRGGWRMFEAAMLWKLHQHADRFDLLYFRVSPSRLLARQLKRIAALKCLEVNGLEIIDIPDFLPTAMAMDVILVGTEASRVNLCRTFPQLDGRVHVHSQVGVDPALYVRIDQAEARRQLSLSPTAKYVLHVSGFQLHHDFEVLLEAFVQLRRSRPEAHLLLVGDGHRQEAVRNLAKTLGCSDEVTFVGSVKQEDLKTWISAADVCVNPLSEAKLDAGGNLKGQKTYEYLACEAPAVEVCIPKYPLPAWANQHLIVVPVGDCPALAEALERGLDYRQTHRDELAAARAFVIEEFSWEAETRSALALLNENFRALRATR